MLYEHSANAREKRLFATQSLFYFCNKLTCVCNSRDDQRSENSMQVQQIYIYIYVVNSSHTNTNMCNHSVRHQTKQLTFF